MVRFFVSAYTIFATGFTASAVEKVNEDRQAMFIDLCIVLTNVVLIVVTFWLIRVTTREAMRNQQETTNLLIRTINRMNRLSARQRAAKHRRNGPRNGSNQQSQ